MPFKPPAFHKVPILDAPAPRQAVAEGASPGPSAGPPSGSVRAHVWSVGEEDFRYPEQVAGLTPSDRVRTGVCFSGGGNRAMVAAWGELRGLVSSGLIDRVDYISSVSGGSWVSTAYTYFRDGPADDEEFLGNVVQPEQITESRLESTSPNAFGAAASESFISRLIEQAINVPMGRIAANDVWSHAVGRTFFERYGLYDFGRPSYFSLDRERVEAIVANNPELGAERFHTVRQTPGSAKRPYLVLNSTLFWPAAGADNFVHFEYSPLYVGSKHRLTVYDPPGDQNGAKAVLGGGFIEPFAFGAAAPPSWPPRTDACASWAGSAGCVDVPAPRAPFTLTDASGTSSAAFAAKGASLAGGFQVALVNRYLSQGPPIRDYWPVPSLRDGGRPRADVHAFGDGGSLDNLGVISLLCRRVERLVVFVNTERRLDLDYDPSDPDQTPPSVRGLDGGIAPYFGVAPADRSQPPTPNNQVFAKEDFAGVVRALQRAKWDGGGGGRSGPAIARTRLAVQQNDWWGVRGGWDVEVCWVYLEQDSEWEGRLDAPLARLVRAGRQAGPTEKALFWGFPNYRTMFQGGKTQILAMSPAEVNLLADFTCWLTTRSKRARLIADTLRG